MRSKAEWPYASKATKHPGDTIFKIEERIIMLILGHFEAIVRFNTYTSIVK